MRRREASFSIAFRHWLRANPQDTCAFEMKQTTTDSLPFSALKDHQENYLCAVQSNTGALIRVQGTVGEPDYVYLRNTPAYVVVKYPGAFHVIPIDAWIAEKNSSPRKSLTSSRAKEIAKAHL